MKNNITNLKGLSRFGSVLFMVMMMIKPAMAKDEASLYERLVDMIYVNRGLNANPDS